MRRPRVTIRRLMIGVAGAGLVLGYVAWLGRDDPRSGLDLAIRLAVGVVPSALFILLVVPLRAFRPPPD